MTAPVRQQSMTARNRSISRSVIRPKSPKPAVFTTTSIACPLEERGDAVLIGDVDRRRRVGRPELTGAGGRPFGVEIGDDHSIALRRQTFSGCPADT
jgi:hypothetical protein